MLRRFSLGINSLECKKRLLNTTAFASIFHRVNLSLAGCSSAEPASVLVRCKPQSKKLYLQLVKKSSHVQIHGTNEQMLTATFKKPKLKKKKSIKRKSE
jgi:hypothetical protein